MNDFERYADQLSASSESELETRRYILHWMYQNIDNLRPRIRRSRAVINQTSVFSYWDPSDRGTPPIIELCLESHRKCFKDQYIGLNPQNVSTYVSRDVLKIPDYCSIGLTHFSDLIRLSILERFGGMWIDATTLTVSIPPQKIRKSDFFLFLRPHDPFLVSVWCIQSRSDSYTLKMWLNSLLQFWLEHRQLVHYFQMHFIFESLVILDPTVRHQYMSIVPHSYLRPHLIQAALHQPNDHVRGEIHGLLESSWIHKLTYKDLRAGSTDLLRVCLSSLSEFGSD